MVCFAYHNTTNVLIVHSLSDSTLSLGDAFSEVEMIFQPPVQMFASNTQSGLPGLPQ